MKIFRKYGIIFEKILKKELKMILRNFKYLIQTCSILRKFRSFMEFKKVSVQFGRVKDLKNGMFQETSKKLSDL